ncbi:MAG: CHASE2 domain-containing protein [Bacteroidia bacterium]|nr:CHASE2 domain-containing protein [Bacteroidia bacterium]MDW8015891.1 CHASE2 domain-containing protein [Bacteroidia bacterium]
MLSVTAGFLIESFLWPADSWTWRIQDLAYKRRAPLPPDTQIVIVDIAKLGRAELSYLILRLSEARPQFIGIDAIFPLLQHPSTDSLWASALCQAASRAPVFIACSLDLSKPLSEAPIQSVSHALFTRCAEEAFANLILYDTNTRIVRECLLYTVSDADTAFSLGMQAALALKPQLAERLPYLPPRMFIRYRGGLEHFYYLSGEEVIRDTLPLSWIQNKALFLGVADPFRQTLEDIFFSPLNSSPLRPSFPDMYGVAIHANIASMLLHEDFFIPIGYGWVCLLMVIAYLLLAGTSLLLRKGPWRSAGIRLLQVALIWGSIELTIWLGVEGHWLPVEPLLWALLLQGEMEIWR